MVTVSFDRQGGSAVAAQTVPLGTLLKELCGDFSVPAGASMTLYAHRLQGTLVVFDSRGGSEIAAVPVNKGFPVNRPIAPQRTGYFFSRLVYQSGRGRSMGFFCCRRTIDDSVCLLGKGN